MLTWYRNLRTSAKLISIGVVSALIVGIVGLLGLSKVSQLNGSVQALYDDRLVPSIGRRDNGHDA